MSKILFDIIMVVLLALTLVLAYSSLAVPSEWDDNSEESEENESTSL